MQLVGYKVAMFLVYPNIDHCIDINSGVDRFFLAPRANTYIGRL